MIYCKRCDVYVATQLRRGVPLCGTCAADDETTRYAGRVVDAVRQHEIEILEYYWRLPEGRGR